MAAVGLAAPMATQLLALSGVAMAQTQPVYKPTKRGGGGPLKVLWWQGPTLLNPHFAVGTKDQDGSRLFYEPLAGWDADGNLRPVLAESIPGREDGTLAADGKSVTWKLKKGVNWHDGKPFTADDVVFNWEYAPDPATAAVTSGSYKDVTVEKVDQHTVTREVRSKPTPFWADAFVGSAGMIIPKHLFADYIGAKSREAPTNLKPVGTGPYMFKDFKPGDLVAGRDQPELPRGEPAALRRHRDEGRRRRGLGGARGAADRRVRLRLEHAGRGRDPAAAGEGRQGPGRHLAGRRHRAHPAQLHRPLDRGRRRALEPQDQASDPERSGGAPGAGPAGRQGLGREAHLRPHRRGDGQLHQQPGALPLEEHQVRVQRRQGHRHPGEGRLEEGRRRHPREGRQEAEVRLPDLDQPAAPEEPGDRQAGLPEGRHRDRAEGGDGVGVLLLRRRQSGHLHQVLLRPADVQQRHASPIRRSSCASSARGRRPPRTTSGRAATSRAGRTRSTTTSTRRRRSSSIRSSAPPCSSS